MAPAIVLIFAHQEQLTWYEKIALEQCARVLGRHPVRLIYPEGLRINEYHAIMPRLQVDFIPRHWLSSVRAYNRLKILPFLYRRYADFEYMLTYELDGFVFRDELLKWCSEGWDYIGAPWYEGFYTAKPDAKPFGVGNSGFSLRRTSSMLRVLRSWRYIVPPATVCSHWWTTRPLNPRSLLDLTSRLTFRNNFFAPFNDYEHSEDLFWCLCAAKRFSWFRIAPYDVARHFSFETRCERLLDECGGQLPFGCHKWMDNDRAFWWDKVGSLGYKLPKIEILERESAILGGRQPCPN